MATTGQQATTSSTNKTNKKRPHKKRRKLALDSKIKGKYSAGVLPISYTVDGSGSQHWWILLSIETREEGDCIHPLAGKKEEIDEDSPIKTATREFHEETMGLYSTIPMEDLLSISASNGHYIYIEYSKMFFTPVLLPYSPHIYTLSDALVRSGKKGSRLFWAPLSDFLKYKQDIMISLGDEIIRPSGICKEWYGNASLINVIVNYKNYLSQLFIHSTTSA